MLCGCPQYSDCALGTLNSIKQEKQTESAANRVSAPAVLKSMSSSGGAEDLMCVPVAEYEPVWSEKWRMRTDAH